jgi:hypothetical protein
MRTRDKATIDSAVEVIREIGELPAAFAVGFAAATSAFTSFAVALRALLPLASELQRQARE